MNSSIYSRLAVTNLKNNRKTYVPYILTAALTVMMYYIIDALSRNDSVGRGSLWQIKLANPVELLRGGSEGEREPKTKWVLAVTGIALVGYGYFVALTTESPMKAIQLFFVAVVCVVLGTYALFVAASIALLKILKKRKNFYYQSKYFTAVSGMIYRMKQNAVGLANICILSTMVLVMISTTICMYMGMDDILTTRYPREFEVTSFYPDKET